MRCQCSFSEAYITKILQETSQSDILTFLAEWASTCNADEMLSLDITSISSYGKNNEDVMPGYNWNREKFSQINLLMVVSRKTKVLVWFEQLSGAISDVTTLRDTIKLLSQADIKSKNYLPVNQTSPCY